MKKKQLKRSYYIIKNILKNNKLNIKSGKKLFVQYAQKMKQKIVVI